jgi:acetylglutamate kinase
VSADITVVKLGGELLEDAAAIRRAAGALVKLAARRSLVVVHGGGRAVDAELRARGQAARFVDGLRVTDEAALEAAISVLAGRNNTALVAAIHADGGRAVGLTGADAGIGLCERARDFTSVAGDKVDLGLVGHPVGQNTVLLEDLLAHGYVPVIASIGVDAGGALLNVNADTLAGHLAAALHAGELIVAGTTPGVLNRDGEPIAELDVDSVDEMTASGAAHSGMVAKLAACRHAVLAGVDRVAIVDGRAAGGFAGALGTRVVSRPNDVVRRLDAGLESGELRV